MTQLPDPSAAPFEEDARALFDRANALARAGDYRRAISILEGCFHREPSAAVAERMVELRIEAGREVPSAEHTPREPWPPRYEDPFGPLRMLPEVGPDALDTETLGGAIQHHGALLVRGLVDAERARQLGEQLVRTIRASRTAREQGEKRDEEGWYARAKLPAVATARAMAEGTGSVLMLDSPLMYANFIDLLRETPVLDAIAGHLGETPVLSAGKTVARCVPASMETFPGGSRWHQDGSFLGLESRTVNLWLAGSHCGVDAPGLDVVPRRLEGLARIGGDVTPISVPLATIDEVAGEVGVQVPVFEPGDALLFDQLFLHQTGLPEGRTKDRYCIESWFFAPSAYPADVVPLLL